MMERKKLPSKISHKGQETNLNTFTNDGSFMEQFRRRMENQKSSNKEEKVEKSANAYLGHVEGNEAGDIQNRSRERPHSSSSTSSSTSRPSTDTVSRPEPNSPGQCSSTEKDSTETKQSSIKTGSIDESGGSPAVKKKHSVLSFVGKRPGSKLTLKTGQVKKKRQEKDEESEPKDAWSKYMAEVKKFRKGLDEDGKNRPLIK